MAIAVRQNLSTRPVPIPWRPSPRGIAARVGVLAAIAAVAFLSPLYVPDVQVNIVSRAAVFAIVALSMNVLVGYTGQVSLGHAAFVGIGAFGAGYAQTELGFPWIPALVVAGITGAVAAVVLGGVALRVRGLYLALVTLAYGLFAQEVVFNLRALTGGGAGMPAPRPAFADGDVPYAYLCIGLVVLAIAFDRRLTGTRAGRAIQALRDDERVAASWGVNIANYKLLAFVISGAMAGIAGGLFASIEGIVAPLDFAFTLSLTFLLMTVVGGVGSRAGVVQGGILIAILPTLLDRANQTFAFPPFSFLDASLAPLVVALLVLATFAFFPGGLAQVEEPLLRWLRFQPFRRAGPAPEPGSEAPAPARGPRARERVLR